MPKPVIKILLGLNPSDNSSHFFLGDLTASFYLITLRINCEQMYSNNRLIYKEQEDILLVPGELEHFRLQLCITALMFLLALKPCVSPYLFGCKKKCYGMHCLHASTCTQFLAAIKMALLNPGHRESFCFQIKSLMLKQVNSAAKTKNNLQKGKAFLQTLQQSLGKDAFTNLMLESITILHQDDPIFLVGFTLFANQGDY